MGIWRLKIISVEYNRYLEINAIIQESLMLKNNCSSSRKSESLSLFHTLKFYINEKKFQNKIIEKQ